MKYNTTDNKLLYIIKEYFYCTILNDRVTMNDISKNNFQDRRIF